MRGTSRTSPESGVRSPESGVPESGVRHRTSDPCSRLIRIMHQTAEVAGGEQVAVQSTGPEGEAVPGWLLESRSEQPEGAPICPNCGAEQTASSSHERYRVCERCNHHFPFSARRRLELLLDEDTFRELKPALTAIDPLL